jgi:hypothetical protein
MNLRNACLALGLAALEAVLIAGATSAIDLIYIDDVYNLPLSFAVPIGIKAALQEKTQ